MCLYYARNIFIQTMIPCSSGSSPMKQGMSLSFVRYYVTAPRGNMPDRGLQAADFTSFCGGW